MIAHRVRSKAQVIVIDSLTLSPSTQGAGHGPDVLHELHKTSSTTAKTHPDHACTPTLFVGGRPRPYPLDLATLTSSLKEGAHRRQVLMMLESSKVRGAPKDHR